MDTSVGMDWRESSRGRLDAGTGGAGRSWATGRVDGHRLGKRRPCAASLGETLQDLLPAPLVGDLKRDPAVEIDTLKRNIRRGAARPPRIGPCSRLWRTLPRRWQARTTRRRWLSTFGFELTALVEHATR